MNPIFGPELSDQQKLRFAECYQLMGHHPLAHFVSDDNTVWWSFSSLGIDPQIAAEIRIGLAAVSFYCDLSDPNNAHGFRTVNHFGGAKAQDALISMLEVGIKKFKT